ncbi:MAG TPA: hypothetical protein VOA87_00410 [Thermoanaerobaculia bacterium]|nr:hypothetical protein [Thermoanaerobaculia bacterium]
MYHVELRQFPHNLCRFNLTERDIRALAGPWAREEWIELGERKWSPHQARLTILEGPELAVGQLSMGRGWRAAERQGQDVTERLLAEARQAAPAPAPAPGGEPAAAPEQPPAPEAAPLGDPLALGVQLASLLGPDPGRLLEAWRALAARRPELSPSESLALAERELAGAGANEG